MWEPCLMTEKDASAAAYQWRSLHCGSLIPISMSGSTMAVKWSDVLRRML